MELGNMMFGHSRGQFPVVRGAGYEDQLDRLFTVIDPDYWRDVTFENETFAVRPYYWGDCTCGYEEKEWAWCEANKHADTCYQTAYRLLQEQFDKEGRKEWGKDMKHCRRRVKALCEQFGIAWNGGLGCAVHCTCDHEGLWREWSALNDHSEDCPIVLPNFHYKPTDYRLMWYKYPLRDSYASEDLSVPEFAKMIDACIATVKVRGTDKKPAAAGMKLP